MVLLEGDGLIEDLYHLLWRKDSPFFQEGSLRVNLPHTIIYKNKKPNMWYFTSRNGSIIRKKFSKLVPEIIQEEFLKNVSKTGIVAYYIYRVRKATAEDEPATIFKTKEQAVKEQQNEDIFIRYFNEQQIGEFLNDPNKPDNGVLQKFVDSYGDHNFVIQEVWSPRVCIFTKKVNLRKATETRFDMYERAMTFEGSEFYSKNVPLRGGTIPGKLRKLTDIIVQHISHISFEKWIINRMVCYFKVDPDENVWFLWCSSVRLKELPGQRGKKFRLNTPLNVNSTIKVDQDIKLLKTNFIDHPVKMQSNLSCITCSKKVIEDELVEVMYKYLIKHEEMQRKHELEKLKRKGKVEIYDALKPADQLKGDRVFVRDNKTNIPEIIRRLHPKMKVKEYEAIKDTDAFLYQTTWICEDCFLMISKDLYNGTDGIVPNRAASSNRVSVPVKRPFSAQSHYAFRQIVLEKNKEYLEYTNQDERNNHDIMLHNFLLEQNQKQQTEALQRLSKKNIKPLEEMLYPDAFNMSQAKLSKPLSSVSSKRPLSTNVPNSKPQSRSGMNSFGTFHADLKSPDNPEDRLDEFDTLRSDLASIYGLKMSTMPSRKIMSADKFNSMRKFQTLEPHSESTSTNKMKRPLTGIDNIIPEYPADRKKHGEGMKKSASAMHRPKLINKEEIGLGKMKTGKNVVDNEDEDDDDDDDRDEIDDIDHMLNVSLPSNFEIDEEDEDHQEEQKKQLEVHFKKEEIEEVPKPKQDPNKPQDLKQMIRDDISRELDELKNSMDRNSFYKPSKNQQNDRGSELSSEGYEQPKYISRLEQMKAIYKVDPSKPLRVGGKGKESPLEQLKPLIGRPPQPIRRPNFTPSYGRTGSVKNQKNTPLSSDDFPMDFNLAARTDAAGSLLQRKDLLKATYHQ